MKYFLSHQKECVCVCGGGEKKSLWQHDSWFIDSPVQFFHPWCFERAKQSLSLLAVVTFPWRMDTPHKHTHAHTHWSTDIWSSQWGGVFNPQIHCHKSNPTPSCHSSSLSMKCSSQWHINSNLQGQSGEERSINRASFILWFLITFTYYTATELATVEDVTYLLHLSLHVDVSHVVLFILIARLCNENVPLR